MSQDWNALSNDAFAQRIREFVESLCPPALRFPKQRLRWSEVRDWYMQLSAAGMLAPNWPAAYGGMGLGPAKHLVYLEEMERAGAPRLPDQAVINLGPLLIRYGTEVQRRHLLPRILAGEDIWCQGYSEPNAGSDLASLRMAAMPDGEDFVINGQKIWTTWAIDATHMFALVRTDPTVAKQAGISFLLIDLRQPGITIRPIRTILGHEEFCEVFFDNARAPRANLVGNLNAGWTMAKALLGFERVWAGSPRQAKSLLAKLTQFSQACGRTAQPVLRDRLTQLTLDVLDLESAYEHFAAIVRRGDPLGADVSILKIWATETCQRIAELTVDTCGAAGALDGDVVVGGASIDPVHSLLDTRSFTIYGGSSEIQRNILAKNVLDLPG